MCWNDIYLSLANDRNDRQAWAAAEHIVRGWARAALHQYGQAVMEDTVPDTCAALAVNFDRAHGPLTCGGFALGMFYNARRRALRSATAPVIRLDQVEELESTGGFGDL